MSDDAIRKYEKRPEKSGKIVTRFAPSPTGPFHIGSLRTALFNFLAARGEGGAMILRIEDTDKERSKRKYEDEICEGLRWAGIGYDGPYRQSERADIYEKHIASLLRAGAAFESREEAGGGKDAAIRFRNPGRTVTFSDRVRGEITFNTAELGDFVIARSRREPLYHLAVVIDDFEMGITHVIRGEDHISNTPRQILIQEALGAPLPVYAHMPLVLAPDRSKLSKRRDASSVAEYRAKGYLPEALVNFLALLGWSPLDTARGKPLDTEIFTMDELVGLFSLDRIQKGGAASNREKLDWINREHMKRLPKNELARRMLAFLPDELKKLAGCDERRMRALVPTVLERIEKFSDLVRMHEEGELRYFFYPPQYDPAGLVWKKGGDIAGTKKYIDKIIKLLEEIQPGEFTAEHVKSAVWEYAEEEGRGNVLWPMRYAFSGRDKSPDPFRLAEILGKEETIRRLEAASEKLKKII